MISVKTLRYVFTLDMVLFYATARGMSSAMQQSCNYNVYATRRGTANIVPGIDAHS